MLPAKETKKEKSTLVSILFRAFKSETPAPRKSKFHVEHNIKAATKNSNILLQYNNNVLAAIHSDEGSDLQPGCEMKDPNVLHTVFELHDDAE